MTSGNPEMARREVKARDSGWAKRTAAALAAAGVRPNTISLLSVVFAAGCGGCLVLSAWARPWVTAVLYMLAVLLIAGRLLCNLFDGMVAVEGGCATRSGVIFNDLPDRVADALILVGAGYAAGRVPFAVELGWLAGLLAVLTAYTRVLAGAAGAPQRFTGPMAKPQRMAVLVAALIAGAATVRWDRQAAILTVALAVIAVGCLITVVRRAVATARDLEAT